MKTPKLDNVSSKYGAPMGRRNYLSCSRLTIAPKLQLVRLKWVDGDYDQGGAYWGNSGGTSIYQAHGENPQPVDPSEEIIECFVRARNRTEAKAKVRELLPLAKFYC